MPRGADPKREHEYEKLVDEFHDEHRYPGREKEVASRIVNKQRREHSETKDAVTDDRHGESPDSSLPIESYDHKDADAIVERLGSLSKSEVAKIKSYEESHRKRKTLMEEIDRRLS